MERKFMQSFTALSAWLLFLFTTARAAEFGEIFVSNLLGENKLESLDSRGMLEKRACEPGYFSCGDGWCAPNGSTCCANHHYAESGWYCCPDGTGRSAPLGSLCCPGTIYYAPPGYYCCSDGKSCMNGHTCLDCTPEAGESTGGPVSSPVVPTTSSASLPSSTPSVEYDYYTITITYYYYSYYYFINEVTSTYVTTTTWISVYASDSAAAQSSVDDITSTLSFYTPAAATQPSLPPTASATSTSTSTRTSTTSGKAATTSASSSSSSTQVVSFPGAARRVQAREGVWTLPAAWIFIQLGNVLIG